MPLLIISDPLSVWIYRKHIHWHSIKILLSGVLLGIFITYFLVNLITNQLISLIVGLLAVFLVLDQIVEIDIANSTINVTADSFVGGSADAGVGYTTTSSY